MFVTAVTTGGVTLFVGFGSGVGLPPLAMFVTVPREIEITVNVRFVPVPAAKSPRPLQITWPIPFVVVAGSELTNARPTGKLSVTDNEVAVDGPKFVTEIV